jgi:hypothetical protein
VANPIPKTKLTYVRLSLPDFKAARQIADVMGLSLSTWMRTVIRERLELERAPK